MVVRERDMAHRMIEFSRVVVTFREVKDEEFVFVIGFEHGCNFVLAVSVGGFDSVCGIGHGCGREEGGVRER